MARIPKTEIEFNPPVYMCKRASEKHVLDGNINKSFWHDAPFTDYFMDIEGSNRPVPRFKTQAKMMWDDENMYFGAILHGDEIWATLTERDSVIFYDNDFEIFIDPNSDTHEYYEFEMNALNTVWDLLLTMPYRDGGKAVNAFDIAGLRSAVYIDGDLNNPNANNKYWSVEVVMPFHVLQQCADASGRNPNIGEFYRVNFSRVQWKTKKLATSYEKEIDPKTNRAYPEDNWVWSPTGVINIHYPELWGYVFFVQDSETCAIPDDEYIKWELRKIYYREHEHFDLQGKFTRTMADFSDNFTTNVNPCIEITKNSFEVSAVSKDGKREISILANGRTHVRAIGEVK